MKRKSVSTSSIFLLLLVLLLAGCGAPAATSTPIPVLAARKPFLPTATLTPLPATATRTSLPATATPTPLPATATHTSLPPTATRTPGSFTDTPMPAAVAVDLMTSSQERISSPEVPAGNLRELAAGNNAFAFDLYQALRDGQDGLFYSPYSLSVALAMVYAGARGQTEQQMADTLHFELPQQLLHPAFNALDLELASRSHAIVKDALGDEVEQVAFQLNIANAVWGQRGYPFRPEYLDLLALNYGAGVRLVDFRKNAPAAVRAINQWIREETEGCIRDVVGKDDITEDTLLVLANAVYFNAKWDQPFDEDATKDEPFHLLDGNEEIVPMMRQRDDFRYTAGDGYQAIQLPYLNRKVAMVILLPGQDRFREIESRLSSDWVQGVVEGFAKHEVILTMPRFRMETTVLRLGKKLRAMGMSDAFSPSDADFSGITESGPLFIMFVLHKAFIDVDEQKTEAAAATVIKMAPGMPPTEPPPIVMKADRPFIFFIRDIETGTVLFLGRVMDPASE